MEKLDNVYKFHSHVGATQGAYIEDDITGEIFKVLECKRVLLDNKLEYAITAQVVTSEI
mgnify:CR=1 FL=1